MDGGQCLAAYGIAFVQPASGDWVDGGGGTVLVQVSVAADSGFDAPASVVVTGGATACDTTSSGLANDDGGAWSGSWQPAVMSDGPEVVCATAYWPDGGVLASVGPIDVNVDVTPPALLPTLSRLPTDMSDPDSGYQPAFARDEDPVTVLPNASDDGGSGVVGFGYALQDALGNQATGIDANGVVNLQTPTMGEHATFTAMVTAVDGVGNLASAGVTIPVTRWKWIADTGVSAPLFNPAAGADRTIYDTNSATPPSQNLFAINASGVPTWATNPPDGGIAIAGPALSGNNAAVFVLGSDHVAIFSPDGGGLFASQYAPLASPQFAVADAYSPTGVLESFALVGSVAGSTTQIVGIGEDGSALSTVLSGLDVGGLFANSSDLLISYDNASAGQVQPVTARTSSPAALVSGSAGTLRETVISGPVGDSSEAFLVGGGGDTLIRVDLTGSTPLEDPDAGVALGSPIKGEILVPAAGRAFVAVGATKIDQVDFDGGLAASSLTVGASEGMLLGTSELYATSPTILSAIIPSGTPGGAVGTVDWQADLSGASAGTVSAAPGITCGGNSKSLLLIPTSSGHLIAFVIDDTGLNQNAPWPKARHDQFNSANSATPLLSCP